MNSTIYQNIWDADQGTGGSGVPAIRVGAPKPETGGFVEVNEVMAATATHKLFTAVSIPDDKLTTYQLCQRLFNNYTLDPGLREQVTAEESAEETEFIEHIVATPPLQAAREAIAFDREQPVASISDATLAGMVREAWFFQGMSGSKHASGFEHVFVGEQKPAGDRPDDVPAEAGGYHFWYKYFLDDAGNRVGGGPAGTDQITYGGTRYGGADRPEQGLLIPEVVTLNFQWVAPDFTASDPTKTQELNKPIGGFWVGCSPEGLIALGLARTLTKAGKIAKINGVTYQLDLHRLTDNTRAIRTFFPRFKMADFTGMDPGGGTGGGGEPGGGDSGGGDAGGGDTARDVQIVAAFVNPAGNEAGRESVTLVNASSAVVNLGDWQIEAPNGTRLTLSGMDVPSGEAVRLRFPTTQPILRNRAGTIRLFDKQQRLRDTVEYTTEQAQQEGATIVF